MVGYMWVEGEKTYVRRRGRERRREGEVSDEEWEGREGGERGK